MTNTNTEYHAEERRLTEHLIAQGFNSWLWDSGGHTMRARVDLPDGAFLHIGIDHDKDGNYHGTIGLQGAPRKNGMWPAENYVDCYGTFTDIGHTVEGLIAWRTNAE